MESQGWTHAEGSQAKHMPECAMSWHGMHPKSGIFSVSIGRARGYLPEFEIARQLRDAVGGLTYSGSTDVLRNVVARLLGAG